MRPFTFTVPMPRVAGDPASWRDAVRRVEDLGLDAVTISDHLALGWSMEPLVTMTAALEATTRLRAVSLVLGNDYRHPVVLHKAAATLDVLSGGRLVLGLGAGWMPEDYDEAGLTMDPAPVRVSRLEESLEVLRALFAEGPATYDGEHYRLRGLRGLPRTTRPGGVPLLVGGGGRRLLEVAGRLADVAGINPRMRGPVGRAVLDMTRARVAEKVAVVRAAAAAAGRRADAVELQVNVAWFGLVEPGAGDPWVSSMAADLDDPAELAGSPAVLHGSLAQCAEQVLAAREELGITAYNLGGDVARAARLARAVHDQA